MTDEVNNLTNKTAREANRGFAKALADPAAAFARDFHLTPNCALFALCENLAEGAVDTGLFVLGTEGWVPACQRCADRLGYELVEVEWVQG